MKILKYRIVRADTIENLEFNVNSVMEGGWQPFGSVVMAEPFPSRLFQTMVIYEEVRDVNTECEHIMVIEKTTYYPETSPSQGMCVKCGFRP